MGTGNQSHSVSLLQSFNTEPGWQHASDKFHWGLSTPKLRRAWMWLWLKGMRAPEKQTSMRHQGRLCSASSIFSASPFASTVASAACTPAWLAAVSSILCPPPLPSCAAPCSQVCSALLISFQNCHTNSHFEAATRSQFVALFTGVLGAAHRLLELPHQQPLRGRNLVSICRK